MLGPFRHFSAIALAIALIGAAGARGEDFSAGLPAPADTRPTYPSQPPADADRKEDTSAAIAAAMVGSMVAGASCVMLQKQAADAKAAGQFDKAQMLTMMAMQQCAQMAQNMANAAKNDEGKKTISSADQPKWVDLPLNEAVKAPSQTASAKVSEPEQTEDQTVDPAQFKGLNEAAFQPPPKTDPAPGGSLGGDFALGAGVRPLNPIDRASVQFDDTSKGEGTAPRTPIGASSSFVGQTGGAGGKAFTDLPGAAKSPGTDFHGKPRKTASAGGAGGSSQAESGASPTGSSLDLAAMMAQIQGKPPGEAGGNGPEYVRLDSKKSDGTAISIFDYASYRYRKVKKDQAGQKKASGVRA